MLKFYSSSTLVLALVLHIILYNQSSLALSSPSIYNVIDLGAKPDGKTDSTKAFLGAWAAACGLAKPSSIYVPPGRYLVQKMHLSGQCKNSAITIRIDGTLVAPSDFRIIGDAGNWILFEGVNGVTVIGGVLDGQGTGLWACKSSGKGCPSGATVCLNDPIVPCH